MVVGLRWGLLTMVEGFRSLAAALGGGPEARGALSACVNFNSVSSALIVRCQDGLEMRMHLSLLGKISYALGCDSVEISYR